MADSNRCHGQGHVSENREYTNMLHILFSLLCVKYIFFLVLSKSSIRSKTMCQNV